MLRGTRSDLIPEWLDAATARGKRPPDHLLPALLGLARSSPGTRPLIVRAGGPRARWLANLNKDWAFAEFITSGDTQSWQLGTLEQRRAYLAAVRRSDPARSRALVEAAWQSSAAAERAQFLAVLAHGLSADDEPLLERSLDDRAAEVRARAASLLGRLTGSAYAARMTARSADIVRVEPGRITVRPPRAPDAAMERDGVRGPADIVAATPLGTWPPPEQMLALPAGEWEDLLLAGWARAAAAQRDQAWTVALAGRLLGARRPGRDREVGRDSGVLRELLGSVRVPWPLNLTEQVLRRGATPDILAMAAHRGDPAIAAPSAGAGTATDDAPELLRILRFRHDMLKELDD
jgi:Family of unknown function (DUF5691)